MLEARHRISKEEQQVAEEMTTKMSDAQGLEMERLAEEEKILQTFEVILTALGVGSFTWGCVVMHARQYEVVTKVRVEGDMAMVHFINLDWADMFRGIGGIT